MIQSKKNENMKISNSLKHAILIGLFGIMILFLIIYLEKKTISIYSESQSMISLTEHLTLLNGLFWKSTLLIVFVFIVFSFLLFRLLKNEQVSKENLLLSEKRFRTIFESAPLGIALIDSNSGRIHNANPKYSEIIRRSAEELSNIDWMSITHPDDLQKGLSFKSQMNNNNLRSFKMSKRYLRPDGSYVWVDISIATVETGNKIHPLHITMVEDITERKEIEEDIIKNQQNFEEAEKLAKIGSWEYNIETSEIKWSKGHYALFELENETSDILYGKYRSACHPDDFHIIDEMRENAIKTGKGFSYEYRVIGKSGNIKNIACLGEVVRNAEGKIIGLKGTGQDITARKEMENLLKVKEQNALLVRHAAQVPGIIYQYQIYPDGKFLFPYISGGVKELAGITPEEAMQDGFKVFNLVHPDDLQSLMATLHHFINPQESWVHEFRIISPQKGIRWVRGNSKPEEMTDGSILWHGYFADITGSKLAEEELKISKEKLEAVFNGSNDAVMLLTRKGFFDCNPITLKMFGLSERNEFIESHPSDLSPALQPDGKDSLLKANEMIEIAYEKGVNRFEWVHQRKNGENFPAEVSLSAFNYGNERVLQATIHDITQRKLAKNKLAENEALLSSILQTLPVSVFCKDINNDFRYTLWNKTAEDISGTKSEECIGKTDYDCFSKKEADCYRETDIEAIKMNGVLDIPEELSESKNKCVIVHTKKTIVKDSNGRPHFILGVSEDITERKKAEEVIKKSEEKYRSLVENADDVIITLDINNTIQFINHTPSGASIDKVMSTCILNYLPEEYRELAIERIKNVYECKKSFNYEMPGKHLDGTIVWFSISVGPMFSGNEVNGVTLIIRDLTQRKNAEDLIKKSEEKYRSLVENAEDIIITLDKENYIQFINHTHLNAPLDQVVGTSIFDYVPEEFKVVVKQKLENIFLTKKSLNHEMPGRHLDGSLAWFSINAGPLFSEDEVTGTTLILRDISERKKTEEKINQSLKEKEILLKEVHHRVKNNLQIILSILNLQYSNITDKKTLELLRDIRSRIKAMSFIHELLYQTNNFSRINFSEYISNITSNLIYSYTKNPEIDLKLDIEPIFLDLDHAIPCGLIINEIVTNALKYAFTETSNEEHSDEKAEVCISLTQTNKVIQLIIADNGKGFPGDIDYRNTESLGMQLVLTLVQQLRGEIAQDNSNGTKYTITFSV